MPPLYYAELSVLALILAIEFFKKTGHCARHVKINKMRLMLNVQRHTIKGTVSRDFLLLVFSLNQFPPSL
jgi:hypothetical protein